ncbi:ankyrin repeat domain-containing protein [Candidatus Dependentiae bacterium]|nr:ankyrin repeat domain-containing protein [Candidatus Dependentiae bacterium]
MNYSKLLSLVIAMFIYSTAQSAPYQFRRIVILKDNKIIKTIDLISDFHQPVHEMVKKPSRKQKLLSLDERHAFTAAERTLLITLRRLAKQNKQIQLLWEETLVEKGWILPKLNNPVEMDWIVYSHHLKEEFSPLKKAAIVYENGDTYRIPSSSQYDPDNLSPSVPNELIEKMLDTPVKDTTAFIGSLLDPQFSKALKDLDSVKNSPYKDFYDELVLLWQQYENNNIKPLHHYLERLLNKNPKITIGQARKNIIKLHEEDKIEELINAFSDLPDIEFLIKLFASIDHTIIYAGGDHCDKIATYLLDNFNGKLLIDLGTTTKSFRVDPKITSNEVELTPVLLSKTWFYLAEEPQKSFSRFKSRARAVTNLASDKIWDEFIELRNQMSDVFDRVRNEKNIAAALKKEDLQILSKLSLFFNKSSKTFIDFMNVRDGFMFTLLYYAVKGNLLETAKFLIKHGSKINAQDGQGNTPLFYTSTVDMTKLLLENGASIDIKNINGATAIQNAIVLENTDAVSIMLKFESSKKKEEIKSESKFLKESKQEIPECETPEITIPQDGND